MGPDLEFDEPALTAKPAATRGRWHRSVLGLMKLIFALACVLAALPYLVPGGTCCGESARRAQCCNNLKQIALALQSYYQQYGVLPPACVADANGRPMHSWRLLILPFLDQQSLYDQYSFREPWNGPNNSKLLNRMPACFACPSRFTSPTNLTSYVTITGPGTMFPGLAPVKRADITDGGRTTIMVVEVTNTKIPWMAPIDLDARTVSLQINDPRRPGISSPHRGGAQVAFGETNVTFVRESIAANKLRSMITIAGRDGDHYDDGTQQY